jgi:hypothetical protein
MWQARILKGCVKWAEENNVKVIDVKEMEIINDKRNKGNL